MTLLLLSSTALGPTLCMGAPASGTGAGFSCDLQAMTGAERVQHAALGAELFAAVEERKELANGYALRLPAGRWLDTARWAELERKCCPFFAFELDAAAGHGPLWLKITGGPGVKAFMKDVFAL
jgi:hypothetical protein